MNQTKNAVRARNGKQSNGDGEKSSIFHNAEPGEKPRSDAGYFELLSFSMFSTALGDAKLATDNWPDILFGFKNFHVQRVASFNEDDLQQVVERVPVLRGKPQLSAVVSNASAILQISQVYGSFKKYLRSFEKDGPEELLKDMSQRFLQIDRGVTEQFLKSAGSAIKFPESARQGKPGKPQRRRGGQRSSRGPGNQNGPDRNQGNRNFRKSSNKPAKAQNGKERGDTSNRPPRRRKFGWRKKKSSSNKPEPAGKA
jgi:3-methyladenine DNA glycosylase Tag